MNYDIFGKLWIPGGDSPVVAAAGTELPVLQYLNPANGLWFGFCFWVFLCDKSPIFK